MRQFTTHRVPPGPSSSTLGSIREIQQDSLEFTRKNWEKYGDIIRIRFLFRPATIIIHPDAAKYILQQNYKNYDKNIILIKSIKVVLGNGLFTNDGPSWLHQRRLMQPMFHRNHIHDFAGTMITTATELAEQWDLSAQNAQTLDIPREMMNLTMKTIARTLFSLDFHEEIHILEEQMKIMFNQLHSYATMPFPPIQFPTPRNKRIQQAIHAIDKLFYGIIQEYRKKGIETSDLLSLLLAARDETGQPMTDTQIRDELVTLILGGHETSAHALSWFWYILATYPEIEERLHEELETVLQGKPPTLEQLPHLSYLDMLLKEILRFYPPAHALSRHAVEEDEINGYSIPKDSYILISIYHIHRHPQFWDHPHRFDPERFSPEASKDRHRYAYLPFGAGPHGCIGGGFADMQIKLACALLAQQFRLRLSPVDRPVAIQAHLTLRPKDGLPMTISKR